MGLLQGIWNGLWPSRKMSARAIRQRQEAALQAPWSKDADGSPGKDGRTKQRQTANTSPSHCNNNERILALNSSNMNKTVFQTYYGVGHHPGRLVGCTGGGGSDHLMRRRWKVEALWFLGAGDSVKAISSAGFSVWYANDEGSGKDCSTGKNSRW